MSAEPDTQILKGTLVICVLAILEEHDGYGYELIEELEKHEFPLVNKRSVYAVLRRLEERESIESYLQPSTSGPARKYYRITPEGREALQKKALRSFEVYETARKIVTARVDLHYHDGRGDEGD